MNDWTHGSRIIEIVSCICLFGFGCATYKSVAKKYLEKGNSPLAIEYLALAIKKDPKDAKTFAQYTLTTKFFEKQLRDRAQKLANANMSYKAIGEMLVLWDTLNLGKSVGREDVSLEEIDGEIERLKRMAVSEIQREIDARSSTRALDEGDMGLVRRLMAIDPKDRNAKETYQRLLKQFKFVAQLAFSRLSRVTGDGILKAISSEVASKHPELLEIGSSGINSQILVYIAEPLKNDTGWRLVEHEAFHVWVPMIDPRTGMQVVEIERRCPSQQEIQAARNAGRPPPQCVEVKKPCYELVKGELFYYQRRLSALVPWSIELQHLGKEEVRTVIKGEATNLAVSQYFEYRGDPRAKRYPAGWPEGKNNAQPLPTLEQVAEGAILSIPSSMVQSLLDRIE